MQRRRAVVHLARITRLLKLLSNRTAKPDKSFSQHRHRLSTRRDVKPIASAERRTASTAQKNGARGRRFLIAFTVQAACSRTDGVGSSPRPLALLTALDPTPTPNCANACHTRPQSAGVRPGGRQDAVAHVLKARRRRRVVHAVDQVPEQISAAGRAEQRHHLPADRGVDLAVVVLFGAGDVLAYVRG